MQKYKKPHFDKLRLGVNPFINNLSITVNQVSYDNLYKKEDDILVPVIFEMEASKYTKLFTSSKKRLLISSLQSCSKSLLIWVLFELNPGEDYIWINKERYLLENEVSLNTYKKAIVELIEKGLITYTTIKDLYWINPDFFFNGDRVRKYKNNINIIKKHE